MSTVHLLDIVARPWPWYVCGPLIGLMVPALLLASNKEFGISANLQHLCAAIMPSGNRYLRYDWRAVGGWNLIFFLGIALGGFIADPVLHVTGSVPIAASTVAMLGRLGVFYNLGMMPSDVFSWHGLLTAPGFLTIVVGGFLVGFGARYACGCTSGHGITGLSQFELPSLLAVCGFFAGGILASFALLPLIMRL